MKKYLVPLLSLSLLLSSSLLAQESQQKGQKIAQQVKDQEKGFNGTWVSATMILRNAAGNESTRQLSIKTLEVENDGDKSIIVFDTPKDIRNTKLLSWTHALESDEQWLYLPALKRTKRISSKNKSGPFVGSEFAYEDLSSQEIEKYTYQYLGEDILDGKPQLIIERIPTFSNSGYSKQIVWVDEKDLIFTKIDFYDRKDTHLKTLSLNNYQKYLNKFWRAHKLEMINIQTGKSTTLNWGEYTFTNNFSDNDFTPAILRRNI
ncbi:outer membrane lipoprotein-sorting protein [Photobacterium frigidiphilum]|uniref:Outer membrane lipoprotein-sorting protein n=1 Tax=Photobacterium frigidiphilum TaxID=264736 RepID=A0A2T3JFJ1_9GAMM|nr:outer membrane lipoprotein-sorting protein [Photobacterium frigidiphilum]PSU47690.1 outer membrane lipoprotein-sorting protein [Photobacterium frigidiphilum]